MPTTEEYNIKLGESEQESLEIENQEPTEEPRTLEMIVDDEIRSMILRRKDASEQWKEAKRQKWDKCWDHFNQIYDTTNKAAWQSTTFIPASPKVSEVICSNMHAATLGPELPAEYQARRPEYEQAIKDVNDLITVDLDRSDFKLHWTDILRTMCIIGTGIGKIEYVKETALVKIKKRVNPVLQGFDQIRTLMGFPPSPSETIEEKEMLVRDYASIRNVDPYDFFPQPGISDISKDTWVIERGKITNAKLLELQNDPDNPVVNITEDLWNNAHKNPDQDGKKDNKDLAQDEPIKPTAYLPPDQEHELLEYWGPAPIWMVQPELYYDDSRKYEMVYGWFWLIDGIWIVRKQVTPWMDAEPPYILGQYIRVPGKLWGIGPLELIIGLQIELNELRNTRQDEVNLKLNKPIAVLKDMVAKGDWDKLVAEPGAVWTISNVDDIRKALMEIEYNSNVVDSFRSTQEIYNEIQEVTAAVKATIGAGGGDDQAGGDTFRGQLLNKQAAGERFIMYARTFERTGLAKAIRKYYQRIYQFKGYEQAIEILGQERQDFEFTPPELIDSMAKLVPMGVTSMENKGVKVAQMRDEFTLFGGKPWFKEVEHARRMKEISGDDPDRTIFTDEELQTYNETKRALIEKTGLGGPNSQGDGPTLNGSPIAGDVPPPNNGLSRESLPSRGPGASPIDAIGRPAA